MAKAFELKVTMDRIPAPTGVKIDSLECCGDKLYVGSSDGILMQFSVENETISLELRAQLGPKSPITYIRAASALERLFVLCDGTLFVLNASNLSTISLSGSSKFKGISCISVNENPKGDDPFSVQICLGKKKQLIVASIYEENMVIDKLREMPKPILALSMSGAFVCVALQSGYAMCNVETGDLQDLFPHDPEGFAYIARISKEEFLLNAPGGLGMCVTSAGISERPPIQWLFPVTKFIYSYPYVITLSADLFSVYSILDQQHKQNMSFSGGRVLGNFEGKILISSAFSIYTMAPIPIEKQVEDLLNGDRVEEALDLVENLALRNESENWLPSLLDQVRIRAAFIFFKNLQLEQAKGLFIRGSLDYRELISLYPRLLPQCSGFVRASPHFHNMADINQVVKGNQETAIILKVFLIELLEYFMTAESSNARHKTELDTALLKLYSENPDYHNKLVDFVGTNIDVNFEDSSKTMKVHKCHHAQAIFLKSQGHIEESLMIWSSLLKEDLVDDSFPGLQFFVQMLYDVPEPTLWNHVDYILGKDKNIALDIFKQRSLRNDISDKMAVNFLQKYPETQLSYLEFIVKDKKVQEIEFHSQLALMYLEVLNHDDTEESVQRRFRSFIINSNVISPQFLLSRLENTEFHVEKALLYGKMEEHQKALSIFVHKLGDFEAAERYCEEISESSSSTKQKLFTSLLKIYLAKNLEHNEEKFYTPSIALLNRRGNDMHSIEVLQTLPPHWSVEVIRSALRKSLRSTLHERRMLDVNVGLTKGENIDYKARLYRLSKKPICLQENSYCATCKKPFAVDLSITRYPNGVIIHSRCVVDPRVCPLTGQIFKFDISE